MRFLKQIETLFRAGTAGGLSDAQLLERFLERRSEDAEAAFAALVDRHGAMVLRICRQILRDEQDAEDAAQATFLVLARRAGSISRRESLGRWLHGVALRVDAKARAAAMRRRTHERRGGEMRAAGHVVDGDFEAIENQDDWTRLHDELGSLPQAFREPLILCYLDGLSQEQAAAQLRCPLGTIQSRLARGRAKLKIRLEKRGVTLAPIFAGVNQVGLQSCPAPSAWSEATVRLAMQFADGKSQAIVGAGAASVALAEQIVRTLVAAKMKLASATVLSVALLVSGAAVAWVFHDSKTPAPVAATKLKLAAGNAEPPLAREEALPPPQYAKRTIHGIARDEQGRPVAKAWIGHAIWLTEDVWTIPEPLDRVRERREPFRDAQGKTVPAGAPGKYFELRDRAGIWHALHPADVRRYREPVMRLGLSPLPLTVHDVAAETIAAIEKGKDVFEVRTAEGRLMMHSFDWNRSSAHRTDAQGRFSFELSLSISDGTPIHFAAADFSQEALAVVHADDPDGPLEITLRPLREVRARVILKSNIKLHDGLSCRVYTVDPMAGKLDWTPAISAKGQFWDGGALSDPVTNTAGAQVRQLELHLPRGKFKLNFESDIVYTVVDIHIPGGNEPVELPDIELETLAWVRMLDKPAAEIEAVDLDGKPALLADYRGKVVVLVFWSTEHERRSHLIARLADIQKRFKGHPLVILALHDTSLKSPESLKDALGPLTKQLGGDIPVRFLLDRAPVTQEDGRDSLGHVEFGSGRTRDIYDSVNESIFVIDQTGKLVFVTQFCCEDGRLIFLGKDGKLVLSDEFSPLESNLETEWQVGTLAVALEDQFGLPRSPLPKPKHTDIPPGKDEFMVFQGKVVDLDGKPIARAKVAGDAHSGWTNTVETGPGGEFAVRAIKPWHLADIKVEASGFASKCFRLEVRDDSDIEPRRESLLVEPSGVIPNPLVLGPGVEVTGRVLRHGKPVAGLLIRLKRILVEFEVDPFGPAETKTDADGFYHFSHIPAETHFWAHAKLGSLPDGDVLIPMGFQTTADRTTVNLRDLEVEKGRTLAGRIVCADGKALPAGLLLRVESEDAYSSLEQQPGPLGQFKFEGLLTASITLVVVVPKNPVPYPYRLSSKNRCLDPSFPNQLVGHVNNDITDLTILLEPGMQPERDHFRRSQLDQEALADFEDAKTGPITGVPPRP